LKADREEKLKQIEVQRARLNRVKAAPVEPQDEHSKERRVHSMTEHLEELKIYADINDPIVKKKFEDDDGECNQGQCASTETDVISRHEQANLQIPGG